MLNYMNLYIHIYNCYFYYRHSLDQLRTKLWLKSQIWNHWTERFGKCQYIKRFKIDTNNRARENWPILSGQKSVEVTVDVPFHYLSTSIAGVVDIITKRYCYRSISIQNKSILPLRGTPVLPRWTRYREQLDQVLCELVKDTTTVADVKILKIKPNADWRVEQWNYIKSLILLRTRRKYNK